MQDDLHKRVDLQASRIKPYEGFIFLCGGPTDAGPDLPVSIRDAIYRELVKDSGISHRVRIAEEFRDWAHDSIYRDLVSFEKHLAELSSVIVLVLESPGSIAELGLFSVIKEFQRKLLVIVETDHYASNSFIRMGPIDFLEKAHGNIAECHRWNFREPGRKGFDPNAAESLQPDLAEAIRKRVQKPTAERPFQKDSWLDKALLLCDLLNLCSALTVGELQDQFKGMGCAISELEMRQILYLLEKVGLIAMEPKGTQRFYVGLETHLFIRLNFREDGFDVSRFRHDLLSTYEREDKKRFRAIRDTRSRHASII